LHPHFGLERKFPNGRLGKKMPSKEKSNELVVWSATFSNNKKIDCNQVEKRAIEVTIKERMVQNTLIDMVDNETTEGLLLLPAIEGGDYDQGQEVCQIQKLIMILFKRSLN
jgi:hypothetical protein